VSTQGHSRADVWLLRDILNSSDRIISICGGDLSTPPRGDDPNNLNLRDALRYNLVFIGEAAGKLSEETKTLAPDVRWIRVAGLRNILTHQYHQVDDEIVNGILEQHLPILIPTCRRLLEGLET
jgi:uncharacterized protein with HEPN domain